MLSVVKKCLLHRDYFYKVLTIRNFGVQILFNCFGGVRCIDVSVDGSSNIYELLL